MLVFDNIENSVHRSISSKLNFHLKTSIYANSIVIIEY